MKHMKTSLKLLAVLALVGTPTFALGECGSEETEVGFADGNSVNSDCVQPAAMVETEPAANVESPSPEMEPNPNPSAGEDEEGGGGEE